LCPPPGLDTNTSASRVVVGPYKTYEEYCAALYRARQVHYAVAYSDMDDDDMEEPDPMAEFVSKFPGWTPHEPKLTWIDPKVDNLIARRVDADDGSEDWEVFLIDWEGTGWYPAWVQGMQICLRGGIVLVDPKQPMAVTMYRDGEIVPMMLKDFDPEPDRERIRHVRDLDGGLF
jgi:hypothetical protein